jgi:hypothetical protein
MSQESVERFLGRLITDDDFRKSAEASIINTCIEYGIMLSGEEQRIIQGIDLDKFISLADSVDGNIKRSRKNY